MIDLYFDMDGVLGDFKKAYVGYFGYEPLKTPDNLRATNWCYAIEKKIFEKLDWEQSYTSVASLIQVAESAKENKLIQSIQILGATGGKGFHEIVSKQKIAWLKSRGIFKVFDKINFVEHGKDKAEFATPTSILIDDTKNVVQRFRQKGGICIHHKGDVVDVVYQLQLAIELANQRKQQLN